MATKAKNATVRRAQTKAAPQAEAAPKKTRRAPKQTVEVDASVTEKAQLAISRPKNKWNDGIPERARNLCFLGITDKDMARYFGVHEITFHNWKKEHPELGEAMLEGRTFADANVAASLYQRAIGCKVVTQDIKIVAGEPQVVEYVKSYPPDVTAQVFWLKNRRPDLWRDKVENALIGAPAGELTPRIVVEHIKSAMKEAERDAGGQ